MTSYHTLRRHHARQGFCRSEQSKQTRLIPIFLRCAQHCRIFRAPQCLARSSWSTVSSRNMTLNCMLSVVYCHSSILHELCRHGLTGVNRLAMVFPRMLAKAVNTGQVAWIANQVSSEPPSIVTKVSRTAHPEGQRSDTDAKQR